MRTTVVVTLAVAALVLGLACNDDDDTAPDLVAPVAIHDSTWNYDDALLSGALVEEDGCLVVVAADHRILPAFPDDGVIWDPPSHVLTVKGVQFRPGTEVHFGGSQSSASRQLPADLHWVNAPADTCRYDTIWLAGPPSQ